VIPDSQEAICPTNTRGLAQLAERLSQALKDEAELNTAVTRLLKARIDWQINTPDAAQL
jgi:hypothetical protein